MKHYIIYLTLWLLPLIISAQECEEGYTWIEEFPEWGLESDSNCFYQSDLNVLQLFIDNSQFVEDPPPADIAQIDLGYQIWESGRLVDFCNNNVGPGWGAECSGSDYILSGEIPSEIGELTALTRLNLFGNLLSGNIPPEIGNLIQLTKLDLSGNPLTGTIPSEFGNLVNLEEFKLIGNLITGEIPDEIGNLAILRELYINYNTITGSIPETIGNLTELRKLSLIENQLSGSLPSTIGELSHLETLYLQENQLSGEIPAAIGNLTNLWVMNLGDNQFSGEITESVCDIADSCFINIDNNRFCPPYPACLEDIGEQDISDCPPLFISMTPLPEAYNLAEPFPNPFNPTTKISYSLPVKSEIELAVYDIAGRNMVDLFKGEQKAGTFTLEWNADQLPSGVYFVKLSAGEFTQTQKAVLVK